MAKIKCLNEFHQENYALYQGDCCDVLQQFPAHIVDFSIYSPPFSNLFVYSDSIADMGNSSNDAEFFQHYSFLIKEISRLTKPGRLSAVHCSDLPFQKWRDGYIGIKDLSGDIIRAHQKEGWILHSRITIWRDPVIEMTRTKAKGLLYKQLRKDSAASRQGMADYLLVFVKPGENEVPIEHKEVDFSLPQWQEWASPVWMDIKQTNTLNAAIARDDADERHIAPLQLDLIERALILWSNPGETVLSPFLGIGSEGVVSRRLNRKFIGVELKKSYFDQAVKQVGYVERESKGFL